MIEQLLICENGCRDSTIQGPFLRFSDDPTCIYCGGPARPVTAEELETWRKHGDDGDKRRDLQRETGGV